MDAGIYLDVNGKRVCASKGEGCPEIVALAFDAEADQALSFEIVTASGRVFAGKCVAERVTQSLSRHSPTCSADMVSIDGTNDGYVWRFRLPREPRKPLAEGYRPWDPSACPQPAIVVE